VGAAGLVQVVVNIAAGLLNVAVLLVLLLATAAAMLRFFGYWREERRRERATPGADTARESGVRAGASNAAPCPPPPRAFARRTPRARALLARLRSGR